ncbi:unnamed protein product, partial [Meganyctiphanes norvegica]
RKDEPLFPDQYQDMLGHMFQVVMLYWDPLTMYDEHPDPESTIVYPKDSVDVRILDAMAKTLNFTFFSRRPYDNEWGRMKADGNFSGIIGELEHHNADFSLVTGPTPIRVSVTDWSCWYTFE